MILHSIVNRKSSIVNSHDLTNQLWPVRIKVACGSGVVVTREPSKLQSRVRFPPPVPYLRRIDVFQSPCDTELCGQGRAAQHHKGFAFRDFLLPQSQKALTHSPYAKRGLGRRCLPKHPFSPPGPGYARAWRRKERFLEGCKPSKNLSFLRQPGLRSGLAEKKGCLGRRCLPKPLFA